MRYSVSPITDKSIKLSMKYLEGMKEWVISTHYGRSRRQGPTLWFPSLPTMKQLWQEHAPGRSALHLDLVGYRFPVVSHQLFVGGGQNSTARERNKFLEAVLKESSLAMPSFASGSGPGPL